ncbi:hypothetical protein FA95DRAFT_1578917, partial [Auriscalpium vulgare]
SGQDIDLVLIWEMHDASEDLICPGRNGVARLAIRLLSIVANSADTERTFSNFGIIHTKRRNHLSVQKVHKATTVKMDLRRDHAARGLGAGSQRSKRKFGHDEPKTTPELYSIDIPSSDEEDGAAVDFHSIGNALITDAIDALDEPGPVTPPALFPLIVPDGVEAQTRVAKTAIPLATLFRYPQHDDTAELPIGVDFFWRGAMRNHRQELDMYDLVHALRT